MILWEIEMAVYVDPLMRVPANVKRWKWAYSCHLYADKLWELHRFARILCMRRGRFQDRGRVPHYDLTPESRAIAVRAGAIEHTREQLRDFVRVHARAAA